MADASDPILDYGASILGYSMFSFAGLGVLEIGVCIGFLLSGMIIAQTVVYFRRYSRDDPKLLQYMVTALLALEIGHSAAILGMIYNISITLAHFTGIFPQNSYFLAVTNVLENFVSLLVQSFFAFRVYRLSNRFLLGLLCWTLAGMRFVCGICIAVESFLDVPRVPNGIIMITKFGWLITLTFVLGGLVDVVIAALQVWYLRSAVHGLHDVRTLATLENVINWCLQTGLITSITSVLVIICFQIMRNQVWVAIYLVLAKLYSNSLLTALLLRPRRDKFKVAPTTNMSGGLSSLNRNSNTTHYWNRSLERFESPQILLALNPIAHDDIDIPVYDHPWKYYPSRKLRLPLPKGVVYPERF